MTSEAPDARPEPAAITEDADRPVVDDAATLPDQLDLPMETPEADALDQQRIETFDEDE